MTAPPPLTLMYRGRLSSCNHSCAYCPFAKRQDTGAQLARDAADLQRFVAWVAAQPVSARPLFLAFTPYGEALIRRHYREAVLALAALPQVQHLSVQTNLSGPLRWLDDAACREKLTLWCTYHPTQVSLPRFLARLARLEALGVAYSVGMVALPNDPAQRAQIEAVRAALPPTCFLWLNAHDRARAQDFSAEDVACFEGIDPWFGHSLRPARSRGCACAAGEEALLIDGDGRVQRCHFLHETLGNLYTDPLEEMLRPRPCTRLRCDCFIGYAWRRDLPIGAAFGGSHGPAARLSRIPRITVASTTHGSAV